MGDGSGIEELARHRDRLRDGLARHCTGVEQSGSVVLDARRLAPRTGGHGRGSGSRRAGRRAQSPLLLTQLSLHWLLSRTGSWDIALPHIEEFVAACEAGSPLSRGRHATPPRRYSTRARRPRRSARRHSKASALARRAGDPQQRIPWFSGCARVLVVAGRVDDARPLAHEALRGESLPWALADLALVADEVGCTTELAELLEQGPETKWTAASRLLLSRDFVQAAEILHEIGDAGSSRSRNCARLSNLSPKGAALKRTSSCSARSRSGARSSDAYIRQAGRSWRGVLDGGVGASGRALP